PCACPLAERPLVKTGKLHRDRLRDPTATTRRFRPLRAVARLPPRAVAALRAGDRVLARRPPAGARRQPAEPRVPRPRSTRPPAAAATLCRAPAARGRERAPPACPPPHLLAGAPCGRDRRRACASAR